MRLVTLFILIFSFITAAQADPLGTSFTYQGELKQQGQPANGTYDFQFELYDVMENGSAIGGPVLLENITVSEGVFTVELDFGSSPYGSDQLWLDIGVRDGASVDPHTVLAPRQKITIVPFALHASSAMDLGCVDCVSDDEVSDVISLSNGLLYAPSAGGSVGIGTTTPSGSYKLGVDGGFGGIKTSGSFEGIRSAATGSSTPRAGVVANGGYLDTDSDSSRSYGVRASDAYVGVEGTGYSTGVFGAARSDGRDPRYGVYGDGGYTESAVETYGVYGTNADIGVVGIGERAGVHGVAEQSDDIRYGVRGSGNGVLGNSYGGHFSNADVGVFGKGTTQAGVFIGEVFVNRDSTSSEPHIELYEAGANDFARIKFTRIGSGKFFDIAAKPDDTYSDGWLNIFTPGFGDAFQIRGDGYIRINKLGLYGNTMCSSSAGSGYIGNCTSLLKYKTNVLPLPLGLETILKLKPVLFDWLEDGTHDLGFVAEDVAEIDPVLTTTTPDGETQGVRYRQLTAVLTNAIKDQQAIINQQQAQLDELQRQVAELQASRQ